MGMDNITRMSKKEMAEKVYGMILVLKGDTENKTTTKQFKDNYLQLLEEVHKYLKRHRKWKVPNKPSSWLNIK